MMLQSALRRRAALGLLRQPAAAFGSKGGGSVTVDLSKAYDTHSTSQVDRSMH